MLNLVWEMLFSQTKLLTEVPNYEAFFWLCQHFLSMPFGFPACYNFRVLLIGVRHVQTLKIWYSMFSCKLLPLKFVENAITHVVYSYCFILSAIVLETKKKKKILGSLSPWEELKTILVTYCITNHTKLGSLKQSSLYCVHGLLARNSGPNYLDTFSVLHGTKCGYCEVFIWQLSTQDGFTHISGALAEIVAS